MTRHKNILLLSLLLIPVGILTGLSLTSKFGTFRANSTPLVQATGGGDLKTVQALVSSGADINEQEHCCFRFTPLIVAAYHGSSDIVEYLLAHGADPNRHDLHGETALMWAIKGGDNNLGIVTRLIESGADIDATNDHGASPIAFARGTDNAFHIQALIENVRKKKGGP